MIRALALGCLLSMSRSGFTQSRTQAEAGSAAAVRIEERQAVRIDVLGSSAEVSQLSSLLKELIGRSGETVVLEFVDSATEDAASPVLARVSIDLHGTDGASCTVRDAEGRVRVADRRVPQLGSRPVMLDEVAHLVQASIESLLAERDRVPVAPVAEPDIPLPRAAASESKVPATSASAAQAQVVPARQNQGIDVVRSPEQSSRAKPTPAWGFDLGVLLGLHGVSKSAPLVPGGAAAMQVAYRPSRVHVGGWLTAEYRVPFDVGDDDLPPTAQTFSLRALPAVDLYCRRPWSLGIALGAGIDVFRVERGFKATNQPPIRDTSTSVSPVIAGAGVVRFRLTQNVHLTSLWGIEMDASHVDLRVAHGGHANASLWLFRPALVLGLTFTPLGTEPFD